MKHNWKYLCIALIIVVFLIWRFDQKNKLAQKIERAKLETHLQDLENWIGSPVYVYKRYPPGFGVDITTEKEFDEGIQINAYSLRKFRPLYLVVKYDSKTQAIIIVTTETS